MTYLRRAGMRAAARSALPDAWARFDQALGALEALPEDRATLEQAVDIRLGLSAVLYQLDELRTGRERLREAQAVAERLDDQPRRVRAGVALASLGAALGDLDEALASGKGALAIAERLGDLELRIRATGVLGALYYPRAEFERAVELASGNLAALPADWAYKVFGGAAAVTASVADRCTLVRSLAQLGRLDEARGWGERAVEADPAHPGFGAHAEHLLGEIASNPDRFDPERGEAHYHRALTLAEPRGMRPLVAHCHLGLGRLHRRRGARERAAEHLAEAVALYRGMDMGFWLQQAEAELEEMG